MQLKMVEGQYIFQDNLPAYRVIDEAYAEDIFAEITRIIAEKSTEVAVAVLEKLPALLEGKIRKCNDLDIIKFNAAQGIDRKQQLGDKHVCKNCSKKFYDMHKIFECPLCKTAIQAPATLVSM